MGLANVTKTPIVDVVPWGECTRRHEWQRKVCHRPIVKVTFESGRTLVVHDDGSFIRWLGESESGA